MLKIDQIHLRAVILCMLKMGKEHTHILAHNFLNIQPIFNPQKVLKIHHAACSVQNNVEDVEDIKTSHNRLP